MIWYIQKLKIMKYVLDDIRPKFYSDFESTIYLV